jgi:hemoglobin
MHDDRPPLTEDHIASVVNGFYAKVRVDPALGPVFARAIPDEAWPEHLSIIRDFWSTVMLKSGRYQRNPFSAHQGVEGISPELFDRWLSLWSATCREFLSDVAADAMTGKAVLIADSLKAGLFLRPARPSGDGPD